MDRFVMLFVYNGVLCDFNPVIGLRFDVDVVVKNSSGYDAFVVHNRPFSVSMTLNNDATAGRQSSSYSPRIGAKKGALVHICI